MDAAIALARGAAVEPVLNIAFELVAPQTMATFAAQN